MEYSGQYLTYEEYRSLGGTLDLTSFNLLEFEIRRKIDVKTFDRLKDNSGDIPQEVKLCEFKMINSMQHYLQAIENAKDVKSENIDGYSVSYTTASEISDIVKSQSAELDDIIRTYLLRVVYNNEHLMYCGVQ